MYVHSALCTSSTLLNATACEPTSFKSRGRPRPPSKWSGAPPPPSTPLPGGAHSPAPAAGAPLRSPPLERAASVPQAATRGMPWRRRWAGDSPARRTAQKAAAAWAPCRRPPPPSPHSLVWAGGKGRGSPRSVGGLAGPTPPARLARGRGAPGSPGSGPSSQEAETSAWRPRKAG